MDRLAMILFGIPDLRYFAANDLRFLRQFACMKFSVNWLREFVELPPSVDELADLLTMAGD